MDESLIIWVTRATCLERLLFRGGETKTGGQHRGTRGLGRTNTPRQSSCLIPGMGRCGGPPVWCWQLRADFDRPRGYLPERQTGVLSHRVAGRLARDVYGGVTIQTQMEKDGKVKPCGRYEACCPARACRWRDRHQTTECLPARRPAA